MFPLNDFNFVACALATVSAAVGYNVSRRRSRSQSNGRIEPKHPRLGFLKFPRRHSTASAQSSSTGLTDTVSERAGTEPPPSTCGTPRRGTESDESLTTDEPEPEPENDSHKRKRSPSPALTLSDTPPSKRRRTPPAAGPEPDTDPKPKEVGEREDVVVVEEAAPAVPIAAMSDDSLSLCEAGAGAGDASVEPQAAPFGACADARVDCSSSTFEPASDTTPASPSQATPAAAPVTQAVVETPLAISKPPTSAVWHTTHTIVAAKPSSAFHAFSGKSSAFATPSPFATSQQTPIWSTSTSISPLTTSSPTPTPAFAESSLNPLAAASRSAPVQKVATVTGEEDEEVVTELKGAKVFVKRGPRDFCEGILGNVKLLKHKETGAERILFRREPVWKVTMSVRLRPAVRCLFDEAQGALRVTLKEPAGDALEEQLVVYALRRGKSSRVEFADFAEAIMESARAQEQSRA